MTIQTVQSTQQGLQNTAHQDQPFKLEYRKPYSTFRHGKPPAIPYLVDGLLTQGGFSLLCAKPKYGKSSVARYEAVCIAKGMDFLGRRTEQGEVLLISLEDPNYHVDNCLQVMKWNHETDAPIHIVEKLAPSINESIDAIGDALAKLPHVRLVIVDTLAKLLRVRDMNDYSNVMDKVEQVHDLARSYPKLHIQGLVHCKKVQIGGDPFDSLLGSTALRGEPDTSVVIYEQDGHRVIATETRIGRSIEPTILEATLVESAGANVVTEFSLDQELAEWQTSMKRDREVKQKQTYEERIEEALESEPGYRCLREVLLEKVTGNRQAKIQAMDRLVANGTLSQTGRSRCPDDPLTVSLNLGGVQVEGHSAHDDVTTQSIQ